jgi:hypothetical protein
MMTEKRKNELFLKSFLVSINKPVTEAQTEAQKEQALRDLKEIGELLDDPLYIKDKPMALAVCKMLIDLSLIRGMAEESIGHKLGLRLYDYIERT